jgi:hypothetical protein
MPPWLLELMRRAGMAAVKPRTLPAVQAQPRAEAPNPQRVMERRGILPQMETENPTLAWTIYETISPIEYGATDILEDGSEESRTKRIARALLGMDNRPRDYARPSSEDAWRLYLGLPQIYKSFGVSEYRPSRATGTEDFYLSMEEAERILIGDIEEYYPLRIRSLVADIDSMGGRLVGNDLATFGQFAVTKGEDEQGPFISYWDRWDLDKTFEGREGRIGRPFEIYDRIYYDPKTFKPVGR